MKSYKSAIAISAFCSFLLTAAPIHAAVIDYTFSGTFDGSLNSAPLTDQAFTVSLIGDTANITSSGGEYFNTATDATFTIGASTGTLTGTYNNVILNPTTQSIIFGQGQSASPFFVGEGIVNSALSGYNLQTAINLASSTVTQTPNSIYFSSLGPLEFGNITSLSFSAQLLPTPLPAGLLLLASALGITGLFGWFRRHKSGNAIPA